MSNETTPNPYNAKYRDIEEQPRGLVGANDSLAYSKPKRTAIIDTNADHPELEDTPVQATAPSTEEPEEQLENKYHKVDWKKRHDDLKRHHDKKLNSLKSEIDDLKKQARDNRPRFQPPKTPEELATFRAENPDIYDVVETIAHMRSESEIEELKSELKELKEKAMYADAKAAYAELKAMVPDFEQIRTSKDFHLWAEEQPAEIQSWEYENKTNAQLAAKAINLYKADRGFAGTHTKSRDVKGVDLRGSAADTIKTSRVTEDPEPKERIFTTSEIAKMSWQQYDKLRAEIDKANREGRVIRD